MPKSSFRTDQQLIAILDETSDWTISTAGGDVLSVAASLRHAIQKIGNSQRAYVGMASVARSPLGDIIVFTRQVDRLETIILDY